jgi:hypothetical protein
MLTFDQDIAPNPRAELDALVNGSLPDLVECGENNDVWIKVRRSNQTFMLISKQTGAVITRCKIDDMLAGEFYGLTPVQMRVVQSAVSRG